jgi:hypothetical protein
LAGARVADQAERLAFLDPVAGGQGVDGGRVDAQVGVEVEGPKGLVARKGGGLDPALGTPAGPVVALGHQQLGQKRPIRHLVAGGAVGQLGELLPDGGQPQQAAGLVDRGDGGFFGQSALAQCHDPSFSRPAVRPRPCRSWS